MSGATTATLKRQRGLDRAGTVASTLCVLHCTVGALVPSLLVAAGLQSWLSEPVEWGFVLIAVSIAIGAVVHGWRTHRSRLSAALLLGGAGLLLAARLFEGPDHASGLALSLVAGALLTTGHIRGRRCTACPA